MNARPSKMREGGATETTPRNSAQDGGRHSKFAAGMAPIVPVMEQEDRVLMGDGHG